MNFIRTAVAFACAAAVASAFAATPVQTHGRAAATAGNGATATIVSGCAQACHVGIQGRSALNVAGSRRTASPGSVTVRNSDVETVFGRA